MFQVLKSLSLVSKGIIACELQDGIQGIFLLFTANLWSFLPNSRLFKWVHVSNPKLGNFVSFLFPFCRRFMWSHLTSLMETTTASLCLALSPWFCENNSSCHVVLAVGSRPCVPECTSKSSGDGGDSWGLIQYNWLNNAFLLLNLSFRKGLTKFCIPKSFRLNVFKDKNTFI